MFSEEARLKLLVKGTEEKASEWILERLPSISGVIFMVYVHFL
jgi:hypothetical protein